MCAYVGKQKSKNNLSLKTFSSLEWGIALALREPISIVHPIIFHVGVVFGG